MTKSKKKKPIFQHKPLQLTADEKQQHEQYLNADELTRRQAIWRYVEEDLPIPNELKPILLALLESDFTGKPKLTNDQFWRILVKEIEFLKKGIQIDDIPKPTLSQNEAIEATANKYGIEFETLERRYKDGKYRKLKEAIRNIEFLE